MDEMNNNCFINLELGNPFTITKFLFKSYNQTIRSECKFFGNANVGFSFIGIEFTDGTFIRATRVVTISYSYCKFKGILPSGQQFLQAQYSFENSVFEDTSFSIIGLYGITIRYSTITNSSLTFFSAKSGFILSSQIANSTLKLEDIRSVQIQNSEFNNDRLSFFSIGSLSFFNSKFDKGILREMFFINRLDMYTCTSNDGHWFNARSVIGASFTDCSVNGDGINYNPESILLDTIESVKIVNFIITNFRGNGIKSFNIGSFDILNSICKNTETYVGDSCISVRNTDMLTINQCYFTNNIGYSLSVTQVAYVSIKNSLFSNSVGVSIDAIASTNLLLDAVSFLNNTIGPTSSELQNAFDFNAQNINELTIVNSFTTGPEIQRGYSIFARGTKKITGNFKCNRLGVSILSGCVFVWFSSPFVVGSVDIKVESAKDVSNFPYGKLIASTPVRVETSPYNEAYKDGLLVLYPGQVTDLKILSYDFMNISQPFAFRNFNLVMNGTKVYSHTNGSTTLYGVSFVLFDQSLIGKERDLELRQEGVTSKIRVSIVDCPSGYKLNYVNENYYVCEQVIDLVSIVVGASFGFILILIVGISFGSISFYLIRQKIVKKLKRLENKEIAEKEIQERIFLKDTIFEEPIGDGNFATSYSKFSPSFLIPVDQLSIIRQIGSGGGGIVYECDWNGTNVAIKTLKKDNVDNEEFETEVSLLKSLRHPNIVNFYGISITSSSKILVIEFMERGSLDNLINDCRLGRTTISLKRKVDILLDISSGMEYLHTINPKIIHSDLKPGNVLMDKNLRCKISDFGLSKVSSEGGAAHFGTMFYLAPEMFHTKYEISEKLDVYSFSIILYELLFEQPPYLTFYSEKMYHFRSPPNANEETFVFSIPSKVAHGLRPVVPFINDEELELWVEKYICPFENSLSTQTCKSTISRYVSLMQKCWSQTPGDRPSFSAILHELTLISKELS